VSHAGLTSILFNVAVGPYALLLDDALKPATPLTSTAVVWGNNVSKVS